MCEQYLLAFSGRHAPNLIHVYILFSMAKVNNGWFAEINDLWYGQAMSFEVENVLCHKKSQYQDILVFER